MTEADWLKCEYSRPMLEFLHGKASDRKLRLFTVACVRLVPAHPACCNSVEGSDWLRRCVEVADRLADGLASADELEIVLPWSLGHPLTEKQQPGLLHDIFGPLPFRPVTLDSSWLTSTVTSLAQAIYDERAFDRMPILGDALEDAGCDNASMLEHCRSGGEHVRGCWVVDLVLGKE
jgi:hypothetical protein